MRFLVVQRILGVLLTIFSATMLPPAAISWYYGDGQAQPFLTGAGVTLVAGLLCWLPARRHLRELRLRDGFVVAALFWIGLSSFASIPLLLVTAPAFSFTDAVFETVSGLTTTGATVISGLDAVPPSILYYRAQLEWLGGMGIIVLAVAVLPMLGVGGMQLFRAETPGPMKDSKLTPRITETAKALWLIYVGLTAACFLAYWYAGMGLFDAACHAFTTVSTGGFSNYDASLGHFDSPTIEAIAVVFMALGGASFALHFLVVRTRSLSTYWRDPEFRTYVLILVFFSLFAASYLVLSGAYATLGPSARDSAFHVVSFMTSTGFTTTTLSTWPGAMPLLLILLSFVGGCAGSTAGGMKVIRWLLLWNQSVREVKRLVHPSAEVPVRLGRSVVPQRVVDAVWGFSVAYIILFGIMLLILVGSGMDQVTAFSAVASGLNNLGTGLGDVMGDFTRVSDLAKWVTVLAMFFGRLEIFTLLVLFSPTFWRS